MNNGINKRKTKVILMSSIILGIAICMAAVIAHTGVNADAVYESGVNKSGLTYGSSMDAADSEDEPDLIAAEATNGKIGYIYRTDLEEAEGDKEVSNPKEAVEYMNRKNQTEANVFSEYISDVFKQEIILDGETYARIKDDFTAGKISASDIASELGIHAREMQASELEEVMQSAFVSSQDANTKTICVYDREGKTIIGLFEVD